MPGYGDPAPLTVVETPEFLTATRALFTSGERAALIDYLAQHPTAGDLVPGAGGIRKLRWAVQGRGKRGGARVIYFYHSGEWPIFAITAYAKNVRENLSQADRNDYRRLTKLLTETYRRTAV